mmetsp:Transcript_10075/g.32851  ORF Transcript_10075/g.32851 Transcript_10075/m.32851 type:complete len:261 (+) Transcript_10075:229-1011(+)
MDSMSISTSESPVGARTMRSWMILMTWLRRSGGRLLMSSESWAFSWKVRGSFILAARLAAAEGLPAEAAFSMDVWRVTSVWAVVFWRFAMVSCMDSICFWRRTNSAMGTVDSPSPPVAGPSSKRGPRFAVAVVLPALPLPRGRFPDDPAETSSSPSPPPKEPRSPPSTARRFLRMPFGSLEEESVGPASWRQRVRMASSNFSWRSLAASWTGASGRTLKVMAFRKTRRISAAKASASASSPSSRRRLTVPKSMGFRTIDR